MNGASWLLDAWVRDFAQVLEMMTAQTCTASWAPAAFPPIENGLWWKQPFSLAPRDPLYIGAQAAAWSELGAQALKAAGIEMFEQAEARSTYIETVQQSLSSLATAITARAGRTVELQGGEPGEPPAGIGFYALVEIQIGEVRCELAAVIGPGLAEALADRRVQPAAPPSPPPPPAAAEPEAVRSSAMDFLLDVELPVSISFGQARLALKDVLKLTTGSVVELDQQPEEPVDVIVNNTVIARGEVVVVEGNYGVRISHIINRQNRLALRHGRTSS